MLENVFVLDLADEQGSFCSKLLADLGATVIKIESSKGDSARNSLSFQYCNTNKFGVALDLESRSGKWAFRRLIEKADVLMETCTPRQLQALALSSNQLSRANPFLVHVSITGFGRTGPKRNYRSHDSIASAFGGQMFVSGVPAGQPMSLFGRQSYYAASLFGANAVLLGLRNRKVTGRGCYIDLSAQEAVASTLDHVIIDYFFNGKITGREEELRHDSFATLRCKDGYIGIPVFRNWDTLIELMESEGKAQELLESRWQRTAYREKHAARVFEVAESWAQVHTRQELFELGQAMQFPWAPIESPAEVRRCPQLKSRRFFAGISIPGCDQQISIPRLPYRFSAFKPPQLHPASSLGNHTRLIMERLNTDPGKKPAKNLSDIASNPSAKSGHILNGIRVVDLTRMLSGPYATRILGDFGAEVIKVQSNLTAHGAERNDNPYFLEWNRNKRSISLNLDHPEARELFLELVSISDVVVENYSPRVLENWGLTYKHLLKAKPDLIMASISAMGQTGPWRNYVGFAPTFHALSGLAFATPHAADRPATISNAYGDVVAGLYASLAILSSLKHRDETGKGQFIDISAYEALCTLLGPAFSALSDPVGDCEPGFRGCYPCAGNDRWCTIAISSEDEWRIFCRIIGDPERISKKFPAIANTKKVRTDLDGLIAQWTIRQKAENVVRRFQNAGIAAGVVQNARDLAEDRHLAARRFFVTLKHPSLGSFTSSRSALWLCREKPANWKSAPLLGEANHYVFAELLGHSDADIRAFIKKRVLY